MTNKNALAARIDARDEAPAAVPQHGLNPPHGGILKDLHVPAAEVDALVRRSVEWQAWDLTPRQLCDLELLATGAFSPLEGFLGEADYDSVVARARLANGLLWPIPVTLDVPEALAAKLARDDRLVLRNIEGVPLAILTVGDVWRPDRQREALAVYGTDDTDHPGVRALLASHPFYVGGRIEALRPIAHHDYPELRDTPRSLRQWLERHGHARVVAFQTRNPLHRAHRELTLRAAKSAGAKLLIQPVVGLTKPGDVDHYTRVRCYRAALGHYPPGFAKLSLLPLAMRMAGPREALWHAIIRKNYGVTHFIVGRDHAGPGHGREGRPFYPPLAAQEYVQQHAAELGIVPVPFAAVAYAANRNAYVTPDELQPGDEVRDISGTELRRRLAAREAIPEWYTFPEVADVLRDAYALEAKRGYTLFLTGLSGSGKSTVAQAVSALLLERRARGITVLDGDVVRRHLSRGLGFSREDRDANVERIAYVASEAVRHGGIAICAPIAPFASARAAARKLVEAHGRFVEIHVDTSLEVCEARDAKGLYALARAGKIAQFTGVSDPYEVPEHPELRVTSAGDPPRRIAERIVAWLEREGLE